MWEFQDEAVEWQGRHTHTLLGDEPGLGKGKQTLQAATTPLMILAPAMIIDGGVYAEELAKWRPDIDQERPGEVTIVPYTSVCERVRTGRGSGTRPLERARTEYLRQRYGTIWLDEAHYIKGRGTTWTKAVEQLARRTDCLRQTTGTPIPNWAYEIFMSAKLLHPDRAGDGQEFGSFWRWAARWFEVDVVKKFGAQIREIGDPLDDSPEGWLAFNEANLGDQYLARTWEQVLPQVPPLRPQTIYCPMVPAQLKAYRELKKQYVTWIEETGAEVNAWSQAGLHTKLARVTTGLEILDPTMAKGASGKLDRWAEIAGSTDKQIFAAAHFRDTVEAICARAQRAGRTATWVHGGLSRGESAARVKAFRAGEVEILAGTIEKVKEGLNFEHVDLCVRIERSWRPSSNHQVARRIRRVSVLRPKLVIDLVAPKCLDERMVEVLASKTDQQVKALRAREFAGLL